jgi:sulfur carrier protein
VEILEGTTYSQLLEILEINPEMVVVIKDGLPLPMDERVEEGEIKIIRVISGG